MFFEHKHGFSFILFYIDLDGQVFTINGFLSADVIVERVLSRKVTKK